MAHAVAPRVTKVPEIRRGDTVLCVTGRDAGKRGTVTRVDRPSAPGASAHVLVEGLNMAKKATRARQRSGANSIAGVPTMEPGGIIDLPMPLEIGKLMLVCPHCDRPTRIRHVESSVGIRQRACARCGQPVEVKGA